MANGYVIPISSDFSQVTKGLDDIKGKFEGLIDKAKELDDATKISNKGRMSGGGTGTGTGGSRNVYDSHEDAKNKLQEGVANGVSGNALKSLQYAEAQGAKRVARANSLIDGDSGGGMGGKNASSMGYALRSFRRGSIGPAISMMAENPELAALGISMAAGYGAYDLANSASDNIKGYTMGGFIAGGTQRQNTARTGIGNFMGMDSAQSAGAAVNFGQALNNGSYGAAYFRQKGLVDMGGLTIDKDTNYLQGIKDLRSITDESEAIRVARDTGMTDALYTRRLTNSQFNDLASNLQDQGSLEAQQQQASYQYSKTKLEQGYSKIVNKVGTPLMNAAGAAMNYAGDLSAGGTLGAITGMALGSAGGPVGMATGAKLGGDIGTMFDITVGWLENKIFGKKKPQDNKAKDSDNADDHSPGMGDKSVRTQQGMVGGGDRAGSAIPVGWKYNQMNDALNGQAQRLGGFST